MLQISHPEDVLIITQTADAVLDVGFLQVNGVAGFAVALFFINQALFNVGCGILFLAVGGEAFIHVCKQGSEPQIMRASRIAFLDWISLRASSIASLVLRGVTYFPAKVPERVEDFLGEYLLELSKRFLLEMRSG